jgi:hypothetical protein
VCSFYAIYDDALTHVAKPDHHAAHTVKSTIRTVPVRPQVGPRTRTLSPVLAPSALRATTPRAHTPPAWQRPCIHPPPEVTGVHHLYLRTPVLLAG